MRQLAADFRVAIRLLLRSRGFAAAAISTVALGLALNASVLAVVRAYLFTPLPYPASDRLYSLRYAPPNENAPRGLESLAWDSLDDVVEHQIAWDLDVFYMLGGDYPERAPGAWVTPGFMQGFGIRAPLGRVFSAEDFQPGSPAVALISHSLWQQRFGGAADIVGRHFNAYVSDRPDDAETFTIVGVLPRDFWHVNPYTQVLAPLRATPTYPYMARLREGTPASDVERRITDLVKRSNASLPPGWHASVRPVHGEYVAPVQRVLETVATAAALVLAIACANVAFLQLIRATKRHREIAMRLALGARRSQIARMLAIEGLTLGGAATIAGVAMSWILLQWLPPLVERQLGRSAPGGPAIALDGVVVATALVVCAATAVVFALAPLAVAWRTSLRTSQGTARSGVESRGSRRARSALVAVEVAASLALLTGCAILVRSALHLFNVDLGLRTERVLSASIGIRDRTYPDDAARIAFFERVLPRLASSPGVESVGLANWPVVSPPRAQPIEVAGSGRSIDTAAAVVAVSPAYFDTLGITLIEGRAFAPADRASAEPVAIVSSTLARRLSTDATVVGRRIRAVSRSPGTAPEAEWRTIVGVVSDVRQGARDEDTADVYVPLLQSPARFASTYVRTTGPPVSSVAAVRAALRDVDPEASLAVTGTLETSLREQLARPRFLAALLTAFSGFAALLAILGMYGVIAYAVRQREHEIAVRMALGADGGRVTRMFVRQGAIVLASGLAVGLYAAATIRRLLEPETFGVARGDSTSTIAAATAFAIAGLLAVWWPARRAARMDPASALRQE